MIKKNKTYQRVNPMGTLFLCILFSAISVALASGAAAAAVAKEKNPFTPKAFVIRYWDKHISNNLPKPSFLLSKASPLSTTDTAIFTKLAATKALPTRLPEFCAAANLLCFPDVNSSLAKHTKDVKFTQYINGENFTSYGTSRPGGFDSFKNYSNDFTYIPFNDFRRYSHRSADHKDNFLSYGHDGNVVGQNFNTYGTAAAGGGGEFKEYTRGANIPDLKFSTYSGGAVGRKQSFSSYSEHGNAGHEGFTNYGKSGLHAENEFRSYGTDSNIAGAGFSNYAEKGTSPNDTFTNYGVHFTNSPNETFQNYADGSVSATQTFLNYRDGSNFGDDSFQSYAKNSRGSAQVEFGNYGKSFNGGTDTFKGYAKGADLGHKIGFKEYGDKSNSTFKDYSKEGVSFAGYSNTISSSTNLLGASSMKTNATSAVSGSLVKRWIEPGKFFRERMLKQGAVMTMPDIRDKLPKRSFLPRSILSKIPFMSSKISELKRIFKVSNNTSMKKVMMSSLSECERAPSMGETKQCVGSLEDMIDFATSVLDHNVAVRTTENVNGSGKNVMLGKVKGINGGKVTKSVSCHQSLFPYLLYYCHSVPKVRLYEVDLLNPNLKAKINHGVAICHLDTTSWSPTHGAFLALGSGPGRIEVCHWIFENDLTWTIAD